MGSTYAAGLAESTHLIGLRAAVEMNLRSNHYPPLPVDYVDPVIEAIENAKNAEPDTFVVLPLGINPVPRVAVAHEDGWAVSSAVLLDITHSWGFVEGDDD